MYCADCLHRCYYRDGGKLKEYCSKNHNYSYGEVSCPDFRMMDEFCANIPEEDQVQKKPDFLAKCMNFPMVSFAKGEVEGVAELICDHYCKFPELIKKEDILHRICEGCPLNALMTHIQGGSKDD